MLRSIRQIVRRISEHSKHLSRDVGLTVPQLLCLKAIEELAKTHMDVTVASLSAQVQLSPATVSRIVERLVRAGLVTRERGTEDRRRVSLSLTEAGRARYADLPMPLQEQFVGRLRALPAERQLALLDALREIASLMDASGLDAAPILAPGEDVKADPSDD